MHEKKQPLKASCLLLLATVFWGLSFVTMQALEKTQERLVPSGNSAVFAALSVLVRFGAGSVVLAFFCLKTFRRFTRAEIWEGIGLGVVGGIGLHLQMDGLTYTTPSTSAFLTQCYCIFIPVIVALRERRWPQPVVVVGSLMVLSGVVILAKFDFRSMSMGPGEWKTLLATLFFTAQILWLEKKSFANNNPNHFSLVMFIVTALIMLPVPLYYHIGLSDALHAFSTPPTWLFAGILTGFCTLGAYVMMNHWQPHIEASKAGLIYCAEPVFTSLFALFIPAWFGQIADIHNPNERWTFNLIVGGSLITGANILVILQTARAQKKKEKTAHDSDQMPAGEKVS